MIRTASVGTSATRATPVLRGAIAGVAGVPTEAVRIIAIQTQRRHLRRRLGEATVVVDYEVEATDSEAVARKLAETTPAEFDTVIHDVAAATGAGAAFSDVRTEEISVAGREASGEEEEEEDDASTSKFASVKFIASIAAGCLCLVVALAVRWCLLHRRGKKTPAVVIEYPRLAPIKEGPPGAPVAYARPVASAPPLAPLAP